MHLYFLLLLACAGATFGDEKKPKYQPGPAKTDAANRQTKCNATANQNVYDYQVEMLNGTFTDLAKYRGNVLLIVNVATYCAYTQQYLDFNPLIEKYGKDGFTILAFPCNQFFLQEPAENHEILNGLQHVRPGNGWKPHPDMQIFGKLQVNGKDHHPLYEFLKESCPQTVKEIGSMNELMYNPVRVDDITWNFEKFLVDRQGRPRFRFHPTAWGNGKIVDPHIQELVAERV